MFIYQDILLRTIELSDLETLRLLRNDPTTWINLTDITMIDCISQRKWFENLSQQVTKKYYIAESSKSEFLGVVRMDEIDFVNRSIRVGCDILPESRGQGFGTKIFDTILKYSFDFLNMHRVWLAVLNYNHVAKRLYEKCGFITEGCYRQAIFRHGKYHDYIIMSILEGEYHKNV